MISLARYLTSTNPQIEVSISLRKQVTLELQQRYVQSNSNRSWLAAQTMRESLSRKVK
jgi:hypothetical protein